MEVPAVRLPILGRKNAEESFQRVVRALCGSCARSSHMCLRAVPWAPTVSAYVRSGEAMASIADPQNRKGRMLWYFFLLAMASLIWSAQGIGCEVSGPPDGTHRHHFYAVLYHHLLFVPLLIRKRRANPDAARPTWSRLGQIHPGRRGGAGSGAVGNDLGDLEVAGFERRGAEPDDSGDHRRVWLRSCCAKS